VSSSSDVRTAWESKIWLTSTVKDMTKKVFPYDVTVDSAFDVAELYYAEPSEIPKINFFLSLVTRRQAPQIMGNIRYTFQVNVQYYLQQEDISSSTYNTLVDRLETVDDLVRTSLTGTWNGTVDYYDGGTPQPVSVVTIDDKKCWRGEIVYIATKTN
jgi:hypothetical protein